MIPKIAVEGAMLAMLILIAGCAPAYHDYPQGCPRYGYCPPPPLPYVYYPPAPVQPIICPPPGWIAPLKDAPPPAAVEPTSPDLSLGGG